MKEVFVSIKILEAAFILAVVGQVRLGVDIGQLDELARASRNGAIQSWNSIVKLNRRREVRDVLVAECAPYPCLILQERAAQIAAIFPVGICFVGSNEMLRA